MSKRAPYLAVYELRLAVISVRATGFDPHRDRLIEVAVVMRACLMDDRTYRKIVDPGRPILAAATELHGLTDADVADAPAFPEIAPSLVRFLGAADLAGFGIHELAIPLLAAEFRRAGDQFNWSNRSVVDLRDVYLAHRPCDLRAAANDYSTAPLPDRPNALEEAESSLALIGAMLSAHDEIPADVDGLAGYPDRRDRAGLFRMKSGSPPVFAGGPHRGRTAAEVALCDPDYLKALLGPGRIFDGEMFVEDALAGLHSIPPPPL